MSGREYGRWKRFFRRCPFGPLRGDMQAGMVARAVTAAAGVKPPALENCLIVNRPKKPKRRITGEDLKFWCIAQRGIINDGGKDGSRPA